MLKVTLLPLLEHAFGKEFISQTGVYVTVKLQLLFFCSFLPMGITQLSDVNKKQITFYDLF